jgi:hypothetical protein
VRRLGKLEVGFWLETSGDFFARPESFQIFAFRFSTQFSQSKSTIKIRNKIHKEFQEFWIFKQAKFRAKKERNVLVEMGILGDCF